MGWKGKAAAQTPVGRLLGGPGEKGWVPGRTKGNR